MENTEKWVTFGTQDTRRRQKPTNKHTKYRKTERRRQYVLDTTIRKKKKQKQKQKNANNVNKTRAFLQTTGS